MDKLELDARVARLERRLSTLIFVLAVTGLVAMLAAFTLVASRPIRTVGTPDTPASVAPTAVAKTGAMVRVISSTGRMDDLDAEIRKLRGMQLQGLITPDDFAAKKALILARPLRVGDEEGGLQAARKLQLEDIITVEEFEALKKKILGLGE
jgi:hypothetical protein